MQVSVVTFIRAIGSEGQLRSSGKREAGIAISTRDNTAGDVDVIVDADGKPVPHIWDFTARYYQGCFNVDLESL